MLIPLPHSITNGTELLGRKVRREAGEFKRRGYENLF